MSNKNRKAHFHKKKTDEEQTGTLYKSSLSRTGGLQRTRSASRQSLLLKTNILYNSFVFLSVYDDLSQAVDELYIMGKINPTRKITINLNRLSLEEKYGEVYHATLYNIQSMQRKDDEYLKQLDLEKIEKARLFVEKTLQICLFEMVRYKKWYSIREIVDGYYESLDEDDKFLEEVRSREKLITQFKNLLLIMKKEFTNKIQGALEKVGHLKDELQALSNYNVLQDTYITNWENSRSEKHEMILKRQEDKLKDDQVNYRTKIVREQRVHLELCKYIDCSQEDYLQDIEGWKEKYAVHTEKLGNEIVALKCEQENQQAKLMDVKALYAKRQKEIDDYLEYKEAKRLEAEALARLNRAATKIQAWWRGTMCRRGLGPYKKVKKRKKSPKGGKKK